MTLLGTITDATHTVPCAGAVVQVDNSANSTVTNAAGYYALINLAIDNTPGQYHDFIITKNGYAFYREERPAYLPSPGTNTHNASIHVGALVTGTVTAAPGGALLAGVSLTANDENQTYWQQVVTLADGTYTLRMPPGTNHLKADAVGYAQSPYIDFICTDQGANMQDMVMHPGGWISGTVTIGGAAAAYVTVTASVSGSTNERPKSSTFTAADGSYLLAHVYPAASDVVVQAPSGYANSYRTNVPVSDGTTTAAVNFALGKGGAIQGVVQDYLGDPVYRAKVTAFPDSGNTTLQQNGETNTAGAYAFSGLPVGAYSVTIKPQPGANLETLQIGGIKVTAVGIRTRNATLQQGGRSTAPSRIKTDFPWPEPGSPCAWTPNIPSTGCRKPLRTPRGFMPLTGLRPWRPIPSRCSRAPSIPWQPRQSNAASRCPKTPPSR